MDKGIEGNSLDGLIPTSYHYRVVLRDSTRNGNWYSASVILPLDKCVEMVKRDFSHYEWADILICDIDTLEDIPIDVAEERLNV